MTGHNDHRYGGWDTHGRTAQRQQLVDSLRDHGMLSARCNSNGQLSLDAEDMRRLTEILRQVKSQEVAS